MKRTKSFLILIPFLLLVLSLVSSYKKENIDLIENLNSSRKAVSLLVREPNVIWLNFLNTFTEDYDVYVIIDDYNFSTTQLKSQYPNINFIKIKDDTCKNSCFFNVNYVFPKTPTAWDKGLYYFCVVNKNYDYVWFIEDDVYIPNKKILTNIDKKHPDTHLLCTDIAIFNNVNNNSWPHWKEAENYFKPPLANGLQCICRMSKKLLNKINGFANENKTLTFLEILFPTLAHQNNLSSSAPDEFKNVLWSQNYNKLEDLDSKNIFHPIKNIDDQHKLRLISNK
jgi:hypothetical protein